MNFNFLQRFTKNATKPSKKNKDKCRVLGCALCGATDRQLIVNVGESVKRSQDAGYSVKYNKKGKLAFPIDIYVCADCATGKKIDAKN